MTTKKMILSLLGYVFIISTVLTLLSEIFMKEYKEQHHFWFSVVVGAISGGTGVFLAHYLGRKDRWKKIDDLD